MGKEIRDHCHTMDIQIALYMLPQTPSSEGAGEGTCPYM